VSFSPQDQEQIEARGLTVAEAERQLRDLREGFPPVDLDRPATRGDGIVGIEPAEMPGLMEAYQAAQRPGRVMKFVPASGAASRMFSDLLRARHAGRDPQPGSPAATFLDRVEEFAFASQLDAVLRRRGTDLAHADGISILAALLDDDGLALAARPKGLVPFHHHPDGPRTPFEEHVEEAIRLTLDHAGRGRIHFTVPAAFRDAIHAHLRDTIAARGVDLAVELSVQEPATDTLALGDDDRPLRDDAGRLVFRPGGHGALLGNLESTGGDLVTLKNIDNVVPDRAKGDTVQYKALLGGLLARRQEQIHGHLAALADGADPTAAETFLTTHCNRPLDPLDNPEARRARARDLLDRPLRVCGMVRNQGEPGGGPFWVRGRDGSLSLQVVEGAQVDTSRPEQAAILARATHFSPVDFLCALRDPRGRPYPLASFVDPETGFVSRKSKDGVQLRALERPGLWNGGMAHWNTILVEVPITTFSPVKTVLDLLRPEHARDPRD